MTSAPVVPQPGIFAQGTRNHVLAPRWVHDLAAFDELLDGR